MVTFRRLDRSNERDRCYLKGEMGEEKDGS